VHCIHVPVCQACSVCVSVSAAWALEGWDLEVCSSLCPWVMAPRLASRRVVVAPCCCVASYAGIRIVSQGLVKPCISESSVLPQYEVSLSGEAKRCKKMVFLAALREKSRCWVTLSYDAHSVSAGLGRIQQPCFQSLSEWNLERTFLKHSPFCTGNSFRLLIQFLY